MLIDHSISRPAAASSAAADQLEREVRLSVARAVGGPGADDVRDLLDHVLEVLALGLVVGGEVQLIQRVGAGAASPGAADRQQQAPDHEQRQASDDQLADAGEQRERVLAAMDRGCGSVSSWNSLSGRRRAGVLRVMPGRMGRACRAFRSRADPRR